jgi:hypothetical protein
MSNSTFYFSQINVENVALTLHNLKANKSTGLDKIPAKSLELSSDIIAPSLTGIYVDDWKRARVIPILVQLPPHRPGCCESKMADVKNPRWPP